MKTRYVYPAVFEEECGAVSVIFPDLGIATSGDDVADAIAMARDALCLALYNMEELKEDIPKPTSITEVSVTDGQFVSFVECDTLEYRKFFQSKAVKKTLSIPSWLNALAEKEDINFSAVLQKALRSELNI